MNKQKLPYFDSQSTFVSGLGTTVEILTFNMNKNPLALGDVMSSLKKSTDLIVICVQESTEWLKTCERRLCSFLEHYQCKYRAEYGSILIGKIQMFVLQNQNVRDNFTFSHETMGFSIDSFDPQLYRPLKGAIFVKCQSRIFPHSFVFVGAHFHAHEGHKFVIQRERDLQQIMRVIHANYRTCNWCLFGDLNFRTSKSSKDEFQQYFAKYGITEHPSKLGNTYKIDVNHRNEFDKSQRTPSRTDRICHNATNDIEILQYGIVKRSADPSTPAGAGSDHYPVFEVFRILNHTTSLSSPFLISY